MSNEEVMAMISSEVESKVNSFSFRDVEKVTPELVKTETRKK